MNHPVFSAAWQLPQTLRTTLPPASTVLPNRPTAAGDGLRNGAKDNNGDFPAPLLALPCVLSYLWRLTHHPPSAAGLQPTVLTPLLSHKQAICLCLLCSQANDGRSQACCSTSRRTSSSWQRPVPGAKEEAAVVSWPGLLALFACRACLGQHAMLRDCQSCDPHAYAALLHCSSMNSLWLKPPAGAARRRRPQRAPPLRCLATTAG